MTTTPPSPKKNPPNPTPSSLFKPIEKVAGHRVLLYGPGGIGKSTLGCMAPGPVAYNDGENSLPVLHEQLTKLGIAHPMVLPAADWVTLRAGLQLMEPWAPFKSMVIELSPVERWCIKHTLASVKNEQGNTVSRLEDYGWGKGYQHVFETFQHLLADLDKHARAGRNVILICHECTKNVPNPGGLDWTRWEPRLQDLSGGKASIKLAVKEWSDHTLFYSYDVAVSKDPGGRSGKASGSGSRTIYTSELPHFMAKSRTTDEAIVIKHGESPWDKILK